MIVAVPKETYPGERRVALVPSIVAQLIKSGLRVQIEAKAGLAAEFSGDAYADVGAEVVSDRGEMIRAADVLLQVRGLGANVNNGAADLEFMREGLVIVAPCDPLGNPEAVRQLAERGVTLFAMELIPRITRAQSMDVLSSMATIAGYKAVLLAAARLPKMFPLLMTAAGTLTPAKVFVIGAGVAGLQAIATARRLGAVVHAYDVRPAVKEQVESLGATFVEMPLETAEAEGAGGYAKQLGEEFYQKQRELMARTVAASDVCITTAMIPGKPSPRLITAEAVEGMAPGSIIVDLAAERGGNCELTKGDDAVVRNGVTILGPTNLPSEVPTHASQMLAKNLTNFMKLIVRGSEIHLNLQDEIVRATLAAYRGEVVSPQARELLGMPPLKTPSSDSPPVDHLATK
ncbi:MAG TPA: Re/Si-specific NAD(P)(+) transhydrogenase subunit alpha [Lacipirellulaceae bacterium]|nr:Re/Si-specific NAD(P)(+) transhydrogenase subunit alpha [Lacipirellulaceae bacterium]